MIETVNGFYEMKGLLIFKTRTWYWYAVFGCPVTNLYTKANGILHCNPHSTTESLFSYSITNYVVLVFDYGSEPYS